MANRLDVYLHMVWATAGRAGTIEPAIMPRLYKVLRDRCRGLGSIPLAVGGMPDHVHMLVTLPATVTIAALVKDIKGASSHLMREEITGDHGFKWQGGYAAFSVSKRSVPAVRAYIANQAEHHARRSTIPDLEPPDD